MANWELHLISAVIRADDPAEAFRHVDSEGIHYGMFADMGAVGAWSYIHSFFNRPDRHGHVPSEDMLLDSVESLALPTATDPIDDIIAKVKEGYLKRQTDRFLEEYELEAEENVSAALSNLQRKVEDLQRRTETNRDILWTEVALAETIEHLNTMEEMEEGVTGLPWPWEEATVASQGIQDGDYIIMWAPPKSLKSWIGLVVAANLLMQQYRVLVYSAEMMWKNIRMRLASIMGGVDYDRLKRGILHTREEEVLLERMYWLQHDAQGELRFTDLVKPDGEPGGVAEMRRRIEDFRPDFMLFDSAYMLEVPGFKDQNDWKTVAALSRQIKQTCKSTGIPGLGIFQENETQALKFAGKGRGTESVSLYKGMVQDCDLGIKLVRHAKRNEVSQHWSVCRESVFPGFTHHAIPSTNWEYAHDKLWLTSDLYEDEENDEPDIPEPPPEDNSEHRGTFTSMFTPTAVGDPTDPEE